MRKLRTLSLPLLGFLSLASVGGSLSAQEERAPSERPRNLILFIADGFGPASRTLARVMAGAPLTLDSMLVGSAATAASSGPITDSAAAATAFACGSKTYSGAIAVDAQGQPLAHLIEGAERRGMHTGIVTTTRITHATPACFSAHVANRSMEEEIASQQLALGLELLMGGGRDFYIPVAAGGKRKDGRDLLAEAQAAGYQLAATAADLDGELQLPVLALFSASHMSYEIDRADTEEPSLERMLSRALELLDPHEDGFLLMVEAGRIDHAAHGNDPAGHYRDILAYDTALKAAVAFARADGETLVICVADHETGGLSLGRNVDGKAVYNLAPDYLRSVRCSLSAMMKRLDADEPWPDVLADQALIPEPLPAEVLEIKSALAAEGEDKLSARLTKIFAEMISRRALVGWATYGHTACDVEVFAFGPGADQFRAHRENAEVGRLLDQLFEFDLASLTAALREEG